MNISLIHILKNKWQTVLAITGITLAVALLVTFVQPLRYGATTRLLIIQRATYTFDTYNALQAAERVAENLTGIVYTTDFYHQVMLEPGDFNRAIFSQDERKRRKQWKEMVDATITRGTGFLTITVYHQDKQEATKLATAVANVMSQKGWEYVGGGDIQVKTVDDPVVSKFPVKPNIILNTVSGLVVGLLLGVLYALGIAQWREGKKMHMPEPHPHHSGGTTAAHQSHDHGYPITLEHTHNQHTVGVGNEKH